MTLFATNAEDELGLKSLAVLKRHGCETKTLARGETAPPDAVVFFTPEWDLTGWPSSHLQAAAFRLMEMRPAWARDSVFLVAVRRNDHGSFEDAVLNIARGYERWLMSTARCLPWGCEPEVNKSAFTDWLSMAADVRGSRTWTYTAGLWQLPPKKKRTRERSARLERVGLYRYAAA